MCLSNIDFSVTVVSGTLPIRNVFLGKMRLGRPRNYVQVVVIAYSIYINEINVPFTMF